MSSKRVSFASQPSGETNGSQNGVRRAYTNPSRQSSSELSVSDNVNGAQNSFHRFSYHTGQSIPAICPFSENNGFQYGTKKKDSGKQIPALGPLRVVNGTEEEMIKTTQNVPGHRARIYLEAINSPRIVDEILPIFGPQEIYTPFQYYDEKIPVDSECLPDKTPDVPSTAYDLATTETDEEYKEPQFGNPIVLKVHNPVKRDLGPLILIYNIQLKKFYKDHQKTKVKQDLKKTPLMELHYRNPPLLVDGRMQMIEIEKWEKRLTFFWRKPTPEHRRKGSVVMKETVTLPAWVWIQRNFAGMYKELWIERRRHIWKTDKDLQSCRILEPDDDFDEEERDFIDAGRIRNAEERYAYFGDV